MPHLRLGEDYRKKKEALRLALLFHDDFPSIKWWDALKAEQASPFGLALASITFGKTCKRCRVYFLTRDRKDESCPWCTQVEQGQYLEVPTKEPDQLGFEGP